MLIYCDAAEAWAMNLQDSATASYESIVDLHDFICYWLILIIGLVIGMGLSLFIQPNNINSMRTLSHQTVIELIWTILPALVLVAIALPSFKALYLADEVLSPTISIKVIAHQWYWSYDYDDVVNALTYDSYMSTTDTLELGDFRLLEVDNALVLPVGTIVRILALSTDVIHSFALPSLGIKVDCMPGRLNQTTLLANRLGTYYGQCSELCGAYHAFMPIKLDIVTPNQYLAWLQSQ